MFGDDTNLFCLSNKLKTLFLNTNFELKKISVCFCANKLSFERRQNHIYNFLEVSGELTLAFTTSKY